MTAPTVKVKLLGYQPFSGSRLGPSEEASSVVGRYVIRKDGAWFALYHNGCRIGGAIPTLEAAKAAAQADFKAIVLSALDTTALDAAVGAALAEAADAVPIPQMEKNPSEFAAGARHGMIRAREHILAFRPDATAALDRVRREARVEGMREAEMAAVRLGQQLKAETDDPHLIACAEGADAAAAAIRAMKKETK